MSNTTVAVIEGRNSLRCLVDSLHERVVPFATAQADSGTPPYYFPFYSAPLPADSGDIQIEEAVTLLRAMADSLERLAQRRDEVREILWRERGAEALKGGE